MLKLGKEVKKVEGVEAMTELCKCGWIVTSRFCDNFTLRQIVDDKGSVFCGFGVAVSMSDDIIGLTLGRRKSVNNQTEAEILSEHGGVCVIEHKAVGCDGTVEAVIWDMARVEAIQPETEVTQ